jgi:hypothetical protein
MEGQGSGWPTERGGGEGRWRSTTHEAGEVHGEADGWVPGNSTSGDLQYLSRNQSLNGFNLNLNPLKL